MTITYEICIIHHIANNLDTMFNMDQSIFSILTVN